MPQNLGAQGSEFPSTSLDFSTCNLEPSATHVADELRVEVEALSFARPSERHRPQEHTVLAAPAVRSPGW